MIQIDTREPPCPHDALDERPAKINASEIA
jgi:hypothetical protein